MKPTVYVETSVISYLTSRPNRDLIIAGNQQVTQEWWQQRRIEFELYISQLVVQEASFGNAKAVADRLQILRKIPLLQLTEEGQRLAEQLVNKGTVPKNVVEDALHIAIATSNGMEYL